MSDIAAPTALSAIRDLRPQAYGHGGTRKVPDPIIEPLWAGLRVLAAVDTAEDGTATTTLTEDGQPLEGHPDIEAAVAEAAQADSLIVDGYLVKASAYDQMATILGRDLRPKTGEVIAQQVLGRRRNRRSEVAERARAELAARTFGDHDAVTFVAVDLLWVDGQPLLDVPLLERKRLLEAVLEEPEQVLRGAYVRMPIDRWVASWKAQGFGGLIFKAANGRYRPGGVDDDWVTAPMPQR